MRYSAEQKRYIARELARSGGNVLAAARALRDNYESLRTINESTVRRWMDEIGSGEMIAQESARQAQVAAEVATQAERQRMLRDIMGSEVDRLARDEAILDDLRELVKGALQEAMAQKEAARLPIDQIARLYERISRLHDARKQRTLPAVTSSQELSVILRIIAEEALTEFGGKAKPFMEKIRERYVKETAQTPNEPAAA